MKWTVRDKSYQGRDFVVAPKNDRHTIAENLSEANAHLIVDCVNGCEGLNPEAVRGLHEAAKGFVTELSESVLEELRYTWGETNFQVVKAKRWLLLQAIAKVEGINK